MPNGNKRHSALKFFTITQGKYQTIKINIRAVQKRLEFEVFSERATSAFRKNTVLGFSRLCSLVKISGSLF